MVQTEQKPLWSPFTAAETWTNDRFQAMGPLSVMSFGANSPQIPSIDVRTVDDPTGARFQSGMMSERRIVTILFSDVTGSTSMAGQLDPEDWAEIMDGAFASLIAPIERYGGTVARLMGDAVLAFFGAPRAHEDDPQRAILAGLDIVDGIQPLREHVRRFYGLDFNVRVGINTGLVVVGAFGSQEKFEYTAMGDGINVAARMEQTAEPGAVQVAHPTYRLTAPFFDFQPLGAIEVKGKSDRQLAYRVLGRRLAPGRIWDIASLSTPLVGREQAIKVLRGGLDDLMQGRGGIISIIGEAGLGKSRLIQEFRNEWKQRLLDDGQETDGTDVQWLENRIVSYESLQPYGALQQRFRKAFQIERDDSAAVAREKVAAAMSRFPQQMRDRAVPIVELILAIQEDAGPRPYSAMLTRLDSQEFKSEFYAVLLEILRGWSGQQPLVYVVDDLHWTDEASADVLTHVLQLAGQIPILFICAYRPQVRSGAGKIREAAKTLYPDRYSEICLQPLSPTDADHLLGAMFGSTEQVHELARLVLDKAEGNPLFLEEIVRSLVDQGVFRRDESSDSILHIASDVKLETLSIPDSLRALLLERIDRLEPKSRWVLQQAAVIGRIFPYEILRSIAGPDIDLDEHLVTLQRAELLRELVDTPEREFAFRHALIWETAYSTVLRRHKRVFHRRVAEVMTQLYDGRLDEYARSLGHHFYEAGDERAITWLIRSAERSRSVYEPRSVIADLSLAIRVAEQVSKSAPSNVYQIRGDAYELIGEYDLARQDFEQVVKQARTAGDRHAEWQASIDLGMAWTERSYERADEHFQRALDLAREIGDESMLAYSLNRLGNWSLNVERPLDARQSHEEALAIFEHLNDHAGRAETCDYLGMANYIGGDLIRSAESYRRSIRQFRELQDEKGLASSLAMLMLVSGSYANETVYPGSGPEGEWERSGKDSVEIARRLGWRAGEAFAQILFGDSYGIRGRYGDAFRCLESGQRIAEQIGHRQWITATYIIRGTLMFDLLQLGEACDLLKLGLDHAQQIGSRFWTRSAGAMLAGCYLGMGQLDRVSELLDDLIDDSASVESLAQRQCCLRRAELRLAAGEPEDAIRIIEYLKRTAPHRDEQVAIPYVSRLHGRALMMMKQYDEAADELVSARDRAGDLSYRPLLWRIHRDFATLYRLRDMPETAAEETARSLSLVDELAESIPEADLRERFRQSARQDIESGLGELQIV